MIALYELVYTSILARCPVDTKNMITHISLADHGDYMQITIAAPKNGGDYARHTNYNRQRGSKEVRNFKWVERAISQAVEAYGGNVDNGLS